MADVINMIEKQSQQRLLFWALLITLSIRLIYFFWSQNSPFLYQYSADERFYIDFAQHLLAGIPFQYANFMDALLAYVLTLPLYFTDNSHVLRLLFLGLDCINVFLVFQLSLLLFEDKKRAFVAALLYGFYGLAIIYSVFISKTTLLNFCLLLQAIVLIKAQRNRSFNSFALAGVLAFFTAQLGAGFLLLLFINALVIGIFSDSRKFVIAYLLGFLLVVASYGALLNIQHSDKTMFPNNGGIIFYIANNATNTVGQHISPAFVEDSTPIGIQQAFKKTAEQHLQRALTDVEISRFWYEKTWNENKDNLPTVVAREWQKLMFMVANTEISQNYYLPYIQHKTLKGIPFINAAFLLAFALLGYQSYKQSNFDKTVVLAPIIVTVIICMVFFVSARMRFSMMPFLAIFAAAGIFSLPQSFLKRLAFALTIFALSMFLGIALVAKETVQDRYNLAVVMTDARMFKEASEIVDLLLKESTLPKYRFLKANLLAEQGDCKEAIVWYNNLLQEAYLFDDVVFNRERCLQFLQSKR